MKGNSKPNHEKGGHKHLFVGGAFAAMVKYVSIV